MTQTTTPTINGLRLVTPEEAGYRDTSKHGNKVEAVLFRGSSLICYVLEDKYACSDIYNLIPLPKPRTIRPFKRGEVKCGDVFRHKIDKNDFLVTNVDQDGVALGAYGGLTWKALFDRFDRLTYDSEGRELLSVAGIEE